MQNPTLPYSSTPAAHRLVIAGAQSGVGKTSVSLGLARALTRRGLRVQTFKVGPDFLDPTYLALASGRTCYNLDTWMCGKDYVRQLFARATVDADVALVEGVMGLFDGASPVTSEGSTAEVAALLDAPVLLVANAHGVARSFAALVKGFVEFEGGKGDRYILPERPEGCCAQNVPVPFSGPCVAGVIANQCGSGRHKAWLADSLRSAALPPLVGAVPRQAFPELRSRHLGLVTADCEILPPDVLDRLADACEQHIDLDAVLGIARSVSPLNVSVPAPPRRRPGVRIGVARDRAFHFYYPDNLQALELHGAELVPFSPMADDGLPGGLHGLYLGGGYPEENLEALSANRRMLQAVREFAESGRPVYAECGGLMYLAQEVERTDGTRLPLAGVLPVGVRMLGRLKSLGYVEVALTEDSLWGQRGATLRGHEFHYSELVGSPAGWRTVYSLRRRRSDAVDAEGFQKGRVLASYVHLHLASRPEAVEWFLRQCEESK
ncbi:MAG: cobyrinate a,c-diamide synthase [Planctomycetes bacterium]|nr:cobyrinate a,c-diamide synthase [Planctomycetota bacterium]MBM4078741.1 cobyrinate a,c-diamide synthase [Planctomycetota bacterium]